MKLTPEEEVVRNYYLSKTTIDRGLLTFEGVLVIVALAVFLYGFFGVEDGSALIFVGFTLCLLASGRFIYAGASFNPHIRSLIQKYDNQLKHLENEKNESTEQVGVAKPAPLGASASESPRVQEGSVG